MKNKYKIEELQETWLELERAGIPLEPKEYRIGFAPATECRQLLIDQDGNEMSNRVFPLHKNRGMAWMLSLIITSNLAGKMTITRWDLQFPWDLESCLVWPEDPKDMVPPHKSYVLTEGLRFPRKLVLNHHMYEKGVLTRGSVLRGLLIGYSTSPIPKEFSDGQPVSLKLTVFDQLSRPHWQELKAWIERPSEKPGIDTERMPEEQLVEGATAA